MRDRDFGNIKININDFIKARGISKNKLMNKAEMQRTQLNNYCNQKVQRLDISILSRICYALQCNINDILEYCPPDNEKDEKYNN